MTTITETWQGRSFPTAYRHALLQIGKGTAVTEIELRKTDAGKYRVTWNVNRGAGWCRGWGKTFATVEAAAELATSKLETLRTWIANVEPVVGRLPGDWTCRPAA